MAHPKAAQSKRQLRGLAIRVKAPDMRVTDVGINGYGTVRNSFPKGASYAPLKRGMRAPMLGDSQT
jgi:hypothetical protein